MMNRERQEKENVSQLQPDMAKAKEGVREGVREGVQQRLEAILPRGFENAGLGVRRCMSE